MVDGLIFEPSKYAFIGVCALFISWILYFSGKILSIKMVNLLAFKSHFWLIIPGYSSKKNIIKIVLYSLALLAFSVCLFRPKFGKKPQSVVQEGRNVLIALDMSRSMLAKDLLPSRLEFIKLKLRVLLDRLGPERVGLILFSDKAFLHCPFTSDFNAFFSFLDQACLQTISSGGTAIGKAIDEAIRTFKNLGNFNNSNKILFLITDGEDFSDDMESSILEAKNAGLKIFTVGAATLSGAPVPIIDADGREIGHEKDRKGGIVMTRLNEKFLRSLSERFEGEFIRVSSSDSDVDKIIQSIEKFEKERMDDRKANLYEDRQNIFSAIFALFLVFEWFI